MERVGFGRRFPAALLDGIFIGILISIAITIYAGVGGTRLALQAGDALGIPINMRTVQSDEAWVAFGEEAEAMVEELTDRFEEDFTPEQAEFMGEVIEDAFEEYVTPERISLNFVMSLDGQFIDDAIDYAFDAVIEADREDIPADKVNELRGEVKELADRFAVAQIAPRAISFALWFLVIPVLVVLGYGFVEAVSGRTIGKLMLGLRVERSAEDDGPAVSNRMARYAVKYSPLLLAILAVATRLPVFVVLSGVAWFVVLAGALAMLGPEKKALHDIAGSTAVYKT